MPKRENNGGETELPRIANLLQRIGIDRYSWLGNRILYFGKRLHYVSRTATNSHEAQARLAEEWKPDLDAYRRLYSHFLRYYHKYTPHRENTRYVERILDVGCGKVFYAMFGKYLRGDYYGVDPNAEEVADGCHQIKRGVAEKIPYPGSFFDVALLLTVLDHVEDVDQTLSEVKRVLKPSGILWVVSVVHRENRIPVDYAAAHLRSFTRRSILQLIGKWFRNVDMVSKTGRFKGFKNVVYIRANGGLK